jgi:hypothetical protein
MGGHVLASVSRPTSGRNGGAPDFRGFPLRKPAKQAKITPL